MTNLGYTENPQPLRMFGGRRVALGQPYPLSAPTPGFLGSWLLGLSLPPPHTLAFLLFPCSAGPSLCDLCTHGWGLLPRRPHPGRATEFSLPSQIWPSPCDPAVKSPQSQRFRLGPICSELCAHLRTLNPGGLSLQCQILPHNLPVWALVRPVRAEREAGPGVSSLPARSFSCMAQDPDLLGYAVHP